MHNLPALIRKICETTGSIHIGKEMALSLRGI